MRYIMPLGDLRKGRHRGTHVGDTGGRRLEEQSCEKRTWFLVRHPNFLSTENLGKISPFSAVAEISDISHGSVLQP